ncbi:MAG: RluA family pseudouridine synthase [Bacillota bacterium]
MVNIDTSENTLTYRVEARDAGRKIQDILQHRLHLSRIFIRELKAHAGIFRNNAPVFANQRAESGDILSIRWQNAQQDIEPRPLPLSIVYEDPDILVLDKQWGILSHPVKTSPEATIANAVLFHWRSTGAKASFHPVTRLDRNTSGLMLIAKNKWAHQQLSEQSMRHQIHKEYIALVYGHLTSAAGTIDAPIARTPGSIITRRVAGDGQKAVTRFRVTAEYKDASLLSLVLETGRTHQIRVHLAYIGHPVIGDTLYGEQTGLTPRQALHAAEIAFFHPRTKERLALNAPLPADMRQLISLLTK